VSAECRFAELACNEQIRLASNAVKLSAFADGWDDEHDLSQPLRPFTEMNGGGVLLCQ
jgi:hypothetical protein